ncbi:MAG TPA: RseA family anti-sigma factor [Lysobacter sp.]|nr:RseA family anti-sigma factor [Lysobacter sp.]
MNTTTHPASDLEALSALFDGELGGDAARFALKRLDHDREWRQACERWSLVGDVMRAQGQALLPAGFPARMRATAVARPVAKTMPRWAAWGGVGLAASVAAVALFFARQTAQIDAPAQTPAPLVATAPAQPVPQQPTAPKPQEGQGAAQLASAGLVVAEVSRQGSQRARASQRSRSAQAPVRQVPVPITATAQAPETAIAAAPLLQHAAPMPFTGEAVPRPWPRAVLPQLGGSGALTTDFGNASPSFYPFEPRLPDERSDASAGQDDPAP